MKICIIADAGHIHSQRWVKYFADSGHEVHLISPTPLGDGDIGRTELYVLKSLPRQIKIILFPIKLLLHVFQIKKLINKIKPDILHVHYIGVYGLWGALSGFHPLVLTAMGSDILVTPRSSRISRYFSKFVLKKADLITCSGQNLIKGVIGLGVEPDKIKLIHRGVDTAKFRPQHKRSEAGHKILEPPIIISTRDFKPVYNVETLIRSAPVVLEKVPEAKFIIAGDGTQRNYLKDLAKSLDVLDSISFIGRIPHDKLPGYLAAADVYVSTSLSDGGSVSLSEAMACGLTPIVTKVGDNERLVTNGENGFVIPIRRPDLLAEKIVYLINNKKRREEMAKSNRPIVEEKANYDKEMGKMARLYEELIKREKGFNSNLLSKGEKVDLIRLSTR